MIIFLAIYLGSQGFHKTATTNSGLVQYYNKPIIVSTTPNFTVARTDFYFQNTKMDWTIVPAVYGNTYTYTINNITYEGLLRVVQCDAAENCQPTEVTVSKPFVSARLFDFPTEIEEGQSYLLQVNLTDPQGEPIAPDSVDVETMVPPDNSIQVLAFDVSGTSASKNFHFVKNGQYIFKIHAKYPGWDIQEQSVPVNVIQTAGIHPIIYLWLVLLGLIVIGFIVARLRHKKVWIH